MRMLLIEDQPTARLVIEACMEEMFDELEGFEFRMAENMAMGRAIWSEMRPHIVLLDLNLPDSKGLDTVESIPSFTPLSDVVVVSGEKELRPFCFAAGAMDFFDKQWILKRVDDDRGPRFKLMDLLERITSSYYRAINGPQRTQT